MKVITTGLLNRFWTKGIKPWLDKRIKSYADLMVTTASGYTPDALAVKEGFTELNGKLKLNFGIETKAITVTTDSNGSAYIEGKYILAVTSDTNDVKITLFNNIYGMWYAKILQSSTDQPYTGNFTLYVLKLKE